MIDFESMYIQELRRRFLPPGPLKLRYTPQWPMLYMHVESRHKVIYNDFAMVGTECVPIDEAMKAICCGESESETANEHGQTVESLQTLLQHPSPSELDRLALKYPMPARMWRHGIHAYLKLFRYRLPETSEYMLAFIYLAYQMAILREIMAHTLVGGLLGSNKETAEEKLKEIVLQKKQHADVKERESLRQAKEAAVKAAKKKKNTASADSIESS
ncbi:hypothetical protein NA57DRAFT_81138 [Rhizodiscina lignyota]|uniref:Uncharacterized protein n=1 Tax=Rhizodiscina lignyota TaxID=1504668 RepID=A0A9P4I647_9PEZI|nr:hypothetical protein NA57DRAFT_81138 [Rhizodiscina lignyota]